MTMVKNVSSDPQVFHVKGARKGAEPKVDTLMPGEEKDLDLLDQNSAHNKGRAGRTVVFGAAEVKKVPG